MTHDRNGSRFEKQVLKTLKGMGITCYGEHGQIPLQKLYPNNQSGRHLEIDIICVVENICILVETTIQKEKNSRKIKKFIEQLSISRKFSTEPT